jgi:hypothetical protein
MLTLIILLLIFLWFLGYGPVTGLQVPLFTLSRMSISLWDIIIFAVIVWLIGILPSPFRQIAGVFFILWILSVMGIIALAGSASMLLIAIIVGLVLYTVAY